MALLLAACGPAAEAPTPTAAPSGSATSTPVAPAASPTPVPTPQPPIKLAVAHLIVVTQPQVFIGFEQKLFEKELGPSVTLDRRLYADGAAMMTAFRNDELDIAYVGSAPAIASFAQKANFKIIAGTNIGGTVIVARSDKGINSLADLKGKTIAVPALAGFQDVVLRSVLLKQAGLEASANADPNKIRIITSSTADQLTKLKEGSADAVITFEPWGTRILRDTSIPSKVLVDWRQVWRDGHYPSSVLIVKKSLLEQRPDVVKRFLIAHVQADLFAETNGDQTVEIMTKQIAALQGAGLDKETIAGAWGRARPTYDPSVAALIASAQLTHDAYPDRAPVPPAVADFVDLTLLNAVLKEKGLAAVAAQ